MPRSARPNCCSECGKPWDDHTASWPRTCGGCDATTWKNLLPVGVLVIPARNQPDHYIVIRRAPGTVLDGELALVGGFMEVPVASITDPGEAILVWKNEVAREALEETGLVIDPASIQLLDVVSAPTQPDNLLVFASCPPQDVPDDFAPNDEVTEVVAIHISDTHRLPWPTHQDAIRAYHEKQEALHAGRKVGAPSTKPRHQVEPTYTTFLLRLAKPGQATQHAYFKSQTPVEWVTARDHLRKAGFLDGYKADYFDGWVLSIIDTNTANLIPAIAWETLPCTPTT